MGCKLEDASEINDPLTQKLIIQVDPNNRDDIKRGIFKALETSKGLIPDIDSFYYKSFDEILGNKIIGFTMLFFVFVFMPVFIYNSWKGKKLSDYTFSNENIQKMKAKSSKSSK